ncbi:MAG TPA: hypothetical protein VFN35_35555 [Ktedonobacteraceae bacterium]|nr:hypothetical protein [Ktedonobacteraceae bacterium]
MRQNFDRFQRSRWKRSNIHTFYQYPNDTPTNVWQSVVYNDPPARRDE